MVKQCPECGGQELYLDCMEYEDRHRCRDTAKSTKKEENNETIRKEINHRYEAKTADRRRIVHAGYGVLCLYAK